MVELTLYSGKKIKLFPYDIVRVWRNFGGNCTSVLTHGKEMPVKESVSQVKKLIKKDISERQGIIPL